MPESLILIRMKHLDYDLNPQYPFKRKYEKIKYYN